jgi:hypothetical protein
MPLDDLESFRFKTCRDLYGGVQQISTGRRNGRPAIFFSPDIAEPTAPTGPAPDLREQERLFVNLTPIERETWRKILAAQSIASIAKEEGVSRAAIYARVEGNCKGQGGMIAKNYWVLLWWLKRQMFREATDPQIKR